MPIATLPMYDWPEVRGATDALWACLRTALMRAGFDAPAALSRGDDTMALWRASDLLIGQTCGYPYATRLAKTVDLVGTPAYGIDCAPGGYFSVLVTRPADARRPLAALCRTVFAFNAPDSQSGFHAPKRLLAGMALTMPEARIATGSHRASIRAVAGGTADFAAIDAVTWELALRHEAAARTLRVVARTPVTRGLPLITTAAHGRHIQALHSAVAEGMAALETPARETLLLDGLTASTRGDYAPLAASA